VARLRSFVAHWLALRKDCCKGAVQPASTWTLIGDAAHPTSSTEHMKGRNQPCRFKDDNNLRWDCGAELRGSCERWFRKGRRTSDMLPYQTFIKARFRSQYWFSNKFQPSWSAHVAFPLLTHLQTAPLALRDTALCPHGRLILVGRQPSLTAHTHMSFTGTPSKR
jgi:hypothetical protein